MMKTPTTQPSASRVCTVILMSRFSQYKSAQQVPVQSFSYTHLSILEHAQASVDFTPSQMKSGFVNTIGFKIALNATCTQQNNRNMKSFLWQIQDLLTKATALLIFLSALRASIILNSLLQYYLIRLKFCRKTKENLYIYSSHQELSFLHISLKNNDGKFKFCYNFFIQIFLHAPIFKQISLKLIVIIEEKAKRKQPKKKQPLNIMSLMKLLQQNIAQAKQSILHWFSLTRQEKRSFSWQQKNVVLYPMLMPLFYNDINLEQLLIPHCQLNDKFNKFFSSTFKIKIISWLSQEPYNLNEIFILNLDSDIISREVLKRNAKIEDKRKKMSAIFTNNIVGAWKRIEYTSNLVKLSTKHQGSDAKILCADKGLMGRFQIEILKQDYLIKSNFINHFLFCGTSPSYSIKSLSVQKLQRGQIIKGLDERIYVLFEGSVIHEISPKNSSKTSKILGQKWRCQLVRGSLIYKNSIKNFLMNNTQKQITSPGSEEQCLHSYHLLTDSIFITISYNDLTRIIKSEKLTKKYLLEKINQTEQIHEQFIRKSINVQQKIREQQTKPIQYHYSIPRSAKTKAFRKKTQANVQSYNYQQFITFDKYEIMTQNKENVEKKHEECAQLSNLFRQRQKQDRFLKKMNTQKGMKEIKKCEYQARLKQNKIEVLAIKESIFNAEKYRDRPHEVKFIFEQEMMDKYLQSSSTKKTSRRRDTKKFNSMVDFPNEEIESKAYRTEQKSSFNLEIKKFTLSQDAHSVTETNKMLHFQSTPNIFGGPMPGRKKLRIGSAITIRKQISRFA